jgi:hypothetical protein
MSEQTKSELREELKEIIFHGCRGTMAELNGIVEEVLELFDKQVDPEIRLRLMWTEKNVPQKRQDELIASITAQAQPGAQVGPWTVGGDKKEPEISNLEKIKKILHALDDFEFRTRSKYPTHRGLPVENAEALDEMTNLVFKLLEE